MTAFMAWTSQRGHREGPQSPQLNSLRSARAMAGLGQKGQFSRPRLNGRCRLRKRSFAANNQAVLVFDGLSLSALEPHSALICQLSQ